jgi:hypothetical protein
MKLKPNQFQLTSGAVISEIPLLFSTDMVKANLEGRKTQTRRTNGLSQINESPEDIDCFYGAILIKGVNKYSGLIAGFKKPKDKEVFIKSPYGDPGDLLWVRETWTKTPDFGYAYRADMSDDSEDLRRDYLKSTGNEWARWKPSIHMPKAASRIWAMVEEIRIERLRDISEEDAKAEGVSFLFPSDHPNHDPNNYTNYTWHGIGGDDSFSGYSNASTAKESFQSLWYKINGRESWNYNPWVWVIKYRILSKTGRPSTEVIAEAYDEVVNHKPVLSGAEASKPVNQDA